MKFSIKDFFSKCDLVTFTSENLNGKLHFFSAVQMSKMLYFLDVDKLGNTSYTKLSLVRPAKITKRKFNTKAVL